MSKYYSSSIAFGAKQTKTEEVVVSPTKIGNVTTDAVSGALTVDEVPVLNSLNPVSSDGVARAVIQAGAELPTRGSTDTGKVLTVANSDGDLEWDAPATATVDQTYSASSTNAQSGVAVAEAVADKQDTISDLETIRSGAAAGATAVQPGNLATVATTGSYTDLIDKPSIPAAQVNSDWNAVSGVSQILNKPNLATVATSGSYSDLSNKPTIPTVPTTDQTYNASSTNPQSGTAVAGAIATVNQVPSSTSADENKVLTVNAQGVANWAPAQGGASYTAGDGLSLSNGEFDVNVGDGLAIGSVLAETSTGSQTIPYSMEAGSYNLYNYVLQLDATLVDAIENGILKVTLDSNTDINSTNPQNPVYPTIVYGSTYYPSSYTNCMTFGTDTVFGPGSVIELSLSNRNQTYGTVDFATIKANPTSCWLLFTQWYSTTYVTPFSPMTPSSVTSINTAYAICSEVPNYLCVSKPVPSTSSGDNGKVLGVTDTSGTLGWVSQPTVPTTDQTYNASSTNPQSGVAVAQAIAAIPSATYTAGDGIDITSNVVSAKAGTGLSIGSSTKIGPVTEPEYATADEYNDVTCAIPLPSDIVTAIDNNETITVVVPQYVDPTTTNATWFQNTNRYVIGAHDNNSGLRVPLSAPAASYYGTFTLNKSNIPSDYLSNWNSVKVSNTAMFEIMGCTSSSFNGWPGSATVSGPGDYKVFDITMQKTTTIQNAINVDNPLPSVTGNSGKVLAVNSGATGTEWINSVPIEVVSSMPASPTAGTLYIVTGA